MPTQTWVTCRAFKKRPTRKKLDLTVSRLGTPYVVVKASPKGERKAEKALERFRRVRRDACRFEKGTQKRVRQPVSGGGAPQERSCDAEGEESGIETRG